MKKILITLLALCPFLVFATTAVPWLQTNLTDGFITPQLVNNNVQGIIVKASSTLANFVFTTATGTSATTTNIFSTTASSTNLFSTLGTIGSLSLNALSLPGFSGTAGILYQEGSGFGNVVTTLTNPLPLANGGTAATTFTTSGNGVYYDGTNLKTASVGTSVTIPWLASTNSTTTNATTTNSFATTASSTNVFATTGNIGTLTVSSCAGCSSSSMFTYSTTSVQQLATTTCSIANGCLPSNVNTIQVTLFSPNTVGVATTSAEVWMQVNGDSGNVYADAGLAAATAFSNNDQNHIRFIRAPGSPATTNIRYANLNIDNLLGVPKLLTYTTGPMSTSTGATNLSGGQLIRSSAVYANTARVTSIDFWWDTTGTLFGTSTQIIVTGY